MPTTRPRTTAATAVDRHVDRSSGFPSQFPPEVLLLIIEHICSDSGRRRPVQQTLSDLCAVCLASRKLYHLGTRVLYGRVVLLSERRAELFLRTARCMRWRSGEMKGRMKALVWGLELWVVGLEVDDTPLMERVLRAVDPTGIVHLGLRRMRFRLAALGKLTSK